MSPTATATGTAPAAAAATGPATATAPARANPAAAPRVLRTEGSRRLVDTVVLVVTLALALLPLLPVYGPVAALPPLAGGLLLGAGVALLAARLRWSGVVTVAAVLAVYLLAGAGLATPTQALYGVVPTPDSLLLLLTGVVTVWKQVLTLDPALGSSGNLLVAPFVLALAGTAGSLSLALRAVPRRRGAWAAVVAPVVLCVSVLLGTKESVLPVVAGLLLVGLLGTWVAWRRGSLAVRRLVSLAVMTAVVGTSGALAGPVLAEQRPRLVVRDELVPPFDPREHPSPLSSFRKFVKDWKETELLTVRGLPPDASVRLATLDAFDGIVWNVAGSESAEGSGEFRRVGDAITTTARGPQVTVELEVHELPFVWLPTVGYAEQVRFEGPDAAELASELRYNDATGTAVLTGGVPDGARWTTDVVVPPPPDDEEIGAATAGSVRLPTPVAVPEAVPLFAGEIAGTATSPVLIARSLEAGLAERGYFSHGLTSSGDYPSLSGHGADRLTTLLTGELMVGDGEQYASAMALMAREMGLPARVVLGFRPDEDEVGQAEITLTGDDIQAWVEIAFAGHGWVSFFPTPDESKTPNDETPTATAEPKPMVMQPPPPPQEPVRPPDEDTEQPRTEDTQEELPAEESWREVVLVGVAVGVPIALVLTPLLLIAGAKRRRRRRRRAAPDPVARVVGGWDEVLDHARDLRRPPPTMATRREVAVRLAAAFAAAGHRRRSASTSGATPPSATAAPASSRRTVTVGGPMAGLAAGADAMVFGKGEPTPEQVAAYWAQVDSTLAVMRAAVPRRQRLRARWSTASLRARRAERRRARRLPAAGAQEQPTADRSAAVSQR